MVIVLADVANLASTALTIAIQRDWIVVITGYNRGHLAGEGIHSSVHAHVCLHSTLSHTGHAPYKYLKNVKYWSVSALADSPHVEAH